MNATEKDHSAGLNGAVAAVLRGERAATGMTLEQLAEASGIPLVSVQRFLAAKRAIDVQVLSALSDALGVSAIHVVKSAQERLARPDYAWSSVEVEVDDTLKAQADRARAKAIQRKGQSRQERRTDYSSFEDSDEAARDEDNEKRRD